MMRKFPKLLAVVLAIAIIICPAMCLTSMAEESTPVNDYSVDYENNVVTVTVSATEGFLVALLRLDVTGFSVDEEAITVAATPLGFDDPGTVVANPDFNTETGVLSLLIASNEAANTALMADATVSIPVTKTAEDDNYGISLTTLQAADAGTIDEDTGVVTAPEALLTFDNVNTETGEIDVEAAAGKNVAVAPCAHADKTTETVPATCTEDGFTKVTCNTCGEVISNEVIEATGHDFEYEDLGDGTHMGVCANCGEEVTAPHVDENADNLCDLCGASLEAEHECTFGDWALTTIPTAESDGAFTRTCTDPECDLAETVTIPKVAYGFFHTAVSYSSADQSATGLATYTRDGGKAVAAAFEAIGAEITDFGVAQTTTGADPDMAAGTCFYWNRVKQGKAYSWATLKSTGYNCTIGTMYSGMSILQLTTPVKFASYIEYKIGDAVYYAYGQVYTGILLDYMRTQSDDISVAFVNAYDSRPATGVEVSGATASNTEFSITVNATYNTSTFGITSVATFTRAGCKALAAYVESLGGEITDFGVAQTTDGSDPDMAAGNCFYWNRILQGKAYSWDQMKNTGYNCTIGTMYTGMNVAQFASNIKTVVYVEYTINGEKQYLYVDGTEINTTLNDMMAADSSEYAVALKDLYTLTNG